MQGKTNEGRFFTLKALLLTVFAIFDKDFEAGSTITG